MIEKKPFYIGKALSILHRGGQWFYTNRIENIDASNGQIGILFYLNAVDSASQDELAKAVEIDKTTVTRAIQKLESSGYIERKRDVTDHRINRVALTELGKQHHDALKAASIVWQDTLTHGLSDEDLCHLERLMNHMCDNVRRMKSDLTSLEK